MRLNLKNCLSLFIPFFFIIKGYAQVPLTVDKVLRQPRILLLVDGSSSMLQPWMQDKNEQRFRTAGRIVEALMDSIYALNPAVEFGLRVYGNQTPAQENDCFDSRREVNFSKDNRTQMALRLASIRPLGVSPIAYSLQQAAENDLQDEIRNAYSIILITDGGESCNGNICEVVASLLRRKIFFKPYVLSLLDDPQLKKQYDCLGNFLIAANEDGIKKSINIILADYTPLLKAPEMVSVNPMAIVPTVPVRQEVVLPIPVIIPAAKDNLSIAVLVPLRIYIGFGPSLRFVASKMERVVIDKNLPVPQNPVIESVEIIPPRKAEPVVTKIEAKPTTAPPPTTVTVKPIPEPPVVVKKPVPKPVEKPKPIIARTTDANYTMKREDDATTSVQVYFTDGRGTYYKTTPSMQIASDAGGEPIKFYRTLDPNGEPDPKQIAPGTYTITVPGRNTTYMRRVVIEANKKNKVEVIVQQGSLRFSYEKNPERPVSEYEAQVKVSIGPGPIITQRGTSELPYPPNMYHIEINTLPVLRYTTDIDFSSITNIMIAEPGFLQVTNTQPIGRVVLYVQRGENWVSFHSMTISGQPTEQRVDILPGGYQARFVKNPGTPLAREVVVPFIIRTTQVTELELQ